MTVLLDTSVIVDVLRDRGGRRDLLRNLLNQGHALACCAVNLAEVYAGMRPSEAAATANFFDRLDYMEISREVARNAGELMQERRHKGKALSLPDAMIAAVALREGLVLATDNVRHFSMPQLKLLSLERS